MKEKNPIFFIFRYFHPPSSWTLCQLESRELLALCLKKLKGLNKVIEAVYCTALLNNFCHQYLI